MGGLELEDTASQDVSDAEHRFIDGVPPPPPILGQIIQIEDGSNVTWNGMSEEDLLNTFSALRCLQLSEETHSSAAAVVSSVLQLQERRVAVHRAFDGAFQRLLSKDATIVNQMYPVVIARATPNFKLVSERIRAGAEELQRQAQSHESGSLVEEAVALINSVQVKEKDRLSIMSALHVEQFQQKIAPSRDGPAKVAELRKCAECSAQEIEETVSELRYSLADLQDLD